MLASSQLLQSNWQCAQSICIYLLYLHENYGENVGRFNGENKRIGKEVCRGEKACSLSDLRIFIYSFFLGIRLNICWGRHFFSWNERLSVCMWILSGMSCPHVGIEMRAREAKVMQWWSRGSETYLMHDILIFYW